jgi:molybdopterin-guanine dinucleotide biosynthesis protein A
MRPHSLSLNELVVEMEKTVVILAGGKGLRFQSRDKCLITLNKKLLIQHAIDNLASVADETIVAARDEQQGELIRANVPDNIVLVFDSVKGFGPLAGILSGLERASASYSFLVGCDMPFVNRKVVEFLFELAARGNYDAVVPRWDNGMVEPLHAVYKREPMLAAVKAAIKESAEKLIKLLARLEKVYYVPMDQIRGIDPDLKTFLNINTPDELEKYASPAEMGTSSHAE